MATTTHVTDFFPRVAKRTSAVLDNDTDPVAKENRKFYAESLKKRIAESMQINGAEDSGDKVRVTDNEGRAAQLNSSIVHIAPDRTTPENAAGFVLKV